MNKIVYGFLALFLSSLFSPSISQAASLQRFQNISSLGTIIYDEVPLSLQVFRARTSGKLTYQQRKNATTLTENLDMYIAWYYDGDTVKKIHDIHPDVKCLLYRNMRAIYSYTPEFQTALDKGWILKDSSGNLVRSTIWQVNYMADIGNKEYWDFIVEWLNNYFDQYGFDGVFADNCLKISIYSAWWGCTAYPVNPRTGQLYTSDEVLNDQVSFLNYVKERIGSKLWISNGIFRGVDFFAKTHDRYIRLLTETSIDGFMSEGIFNSGSDTGTGGSFYSEDKWKKSVDFVVWIQDNFLNQSGKIFLPHSRCKVDQIPVDCTSEQMATFVFSSLLLGIKKSQNYLSLDGAILLDEIQKLYRIDLGVPKGDYYAIEGTHVYARDFTKIKVLVNPTDQTYLVYLDEDYETLEGQIVSSVNVEPHTGVVFQMMQS